MARYRRRSLLAASTLAQDFISPYRHRRARFKNRNLAHDLGHGATLNTLKPGEIGSGIVDQIETLIALLLRESREGR